jgi:alpha-beta hydrolase superfamily lysophospholipase
MEQYNALIPNLLSIGISVYAFDLQGHGRSPGRRAVTDVDRAVADHLAARRKLEAQPLPLLLMGHSLGGIVTATSVARDPSNLRGVILSSPALLVTANPLTRLFARVAAAVAPAMPAKKLPASGISRIAEQVELLTGDSLAYRGRMPARLAASILFTSRSNWDHYPRWKLPTLAIHGTADTFTEPEGSRRFIRTIASDDKTLHLVEGGYHELLNDTDRDETLQVILAWIEQRLPALGKDNGSDTV